jgi:hypothetical protein
MARLCGAVAIGLTAMALVGAGSASAATEVGNTCAANTGSSGFTYVPLATSPGNPLPMTAPSAGVVTSWKVNSAIPTQQAERLKVVQPTGKALEFKVVGESTEQFVVPGANTFGTRISVAAGDRFGVFGSIPVGAGLYCSLAPEDKMAAFPGPTNIPVGVSKPFFEQAGSQVAVSAVVEPDADGDGFGDETQDKCPLSAATQAPCPLVGLDAVPIVKKTSVLLLVASSDEAPVTVSGTVKVAKKSKKAKKKKRAHSSALLKLSGGTHTVKPGEIGRFTVKFPGKLKAQLAGLSRKQSLKLKLKESATNIAGQVTNTATTVKLKGQARGRAAH